MKVQYIKHSGVLVEFEHAVMIFDYYCGKFEMPKKDQHLYFFVSHKHPDHFNPKIFEYAKEHPKVTYILSDDIRLTEEELHKKQISQEVMDKILYVGPNQTLHITPQLSIETLRSTDEGVAFLVNYAEEDGSVPVRLYHAGDLNWWTWSGETPEEYKAMTDAFQAEMQKLHGRTFDLAFVPLDPRQEERFWWGFDSLMKACDVKKAVPMHCWDDYSVIGKLIAMEEARPYRDRIVPVSERGEWLEL